MVAPTPPLVRPRTQDDVPALVELLLRQQPLTRYPYRDPLPFPPEQFVVRPGELAAWVATATATGAAGTGEPRVAGHVSVLEVGEGDLGRRFVELTGRPPERLGAVSVLVVDHELSGRGVGRALLDVAERWLVRQGRTPVLEVIGAHGRAGALYRRRGWQVLDSVRPGWLPEGADELSELMVLRP